MGSRRALASALSRLDAFAEPRLELEQYVTPAEIAASLVHEADLRGDLDRLVCDLGTGTGMLAIAAAIRGADSVGLEIDPDAIATATANAVDAGVAVEFVLGDVTRHPLCVDRDVTVVMNPPFGAQRGRRGADRPFLLAAAELATVSYSVHNAESRAFVEAFAEDHGGHLTHAFGLELDLPAQFDFHEEAVAAIEAEAYRIEWAD